MPRLASTVTLKSTPAKCCRRRPFVEPLEDRMVLSVCGVTCDLIDGQLHIHGTSADDSIAVRYDAATAHRSSCRRR